MFTLKEIAKELGIPPARLRLWLRRDEMELALHQYRRVDECSPCGAAPVAEPCYHATLLQ